MSVDTAYGWLIELRDVAALREAVRRLHAAGMHTLTVHAPFAVPELQALVPPRRRIVPWIALAGGLLGGLGTLAMQYYAAVMDYPVRVGGRPYASWPAFIPAALEMTLLCTAGFGVLGMLIANRLPRWYHPVFNVDSFALVSQDALAIVVRPQDGRGDHAFFSDLVADLDPVAVREVTP